MVKALDVGRVACRAANPVPIMGFVRYRTYEKAHGRAEDGGVSWRQL
jgi:hypothetical protein